MDGSHSLLIRSDSSLALRCRKGAIHPIIQSPRRRALGGGRASSAARLSRARGGDFSVCAMLLPIAAIGTTWMACDEGRQAFTPPRGPLSLHPLVALVLGFVSGPPAGPLRNSCRWPGNNRRSSGSSTGVNALYSKTHCAITAAKRLVDFAP